MTHLIQTSVPVPGNRRSLLCWLAALAAPLPGPAAGAEPWPSRPISLIVLSPPGSPPDVVARELVDRIGMRLGQPIVVENISSAGGIVGMERTRHALPDGHHFVFTHIGAVVISPALFKSLPYDPVRDFDPVSLILTGPMILVASSASGIETVAQLREAALQPGGLMYGSGGIGGPSHVFTEQFKAAAGLKLDHVPFKGAPGLVLALRGSQVPVGMESATSLMPLIESGKVRALAVSGESRMSILSKVPTFGELGFPGIGVSWMAVMAPKATLAEAVSGLNRELARVLALPDLQRSWAALGRTVGGGPPAVLAERIRVELPRWREVIAAAGIRPE